MVLSGLDRHREFDLSAEPAVRNFDIVKGAAIPGHGPDRFSCAFDDHVSFVQIECEISGFDTGDLNGGDDLVIDDVEVVQGLPLNELQEDQVLFIELREIIKKDVKLSDFAIFVCSDR